MYMQLYIVQYWKCAHDGHHENINVKEEKLHSYFMQDEATAYTANSKNYGIFDKLITSELWPP